MPKKPNRCHICEKVKFAAGVDVPLKNMCFRKPHLMNIDAVKCYRRGYLKYRKQYELVLRMGEKCK